uniref:Uncharacterized protein n=1 Tax=viral metagenome TaxID=1070528 RepID=A0A6M3L2J8_9ZZZZ
MDKLEQKSAKVEVNTPETTKKEEKVMENEQNVKSLEEQYEDLKKKDSPVLKETRRVAKSNNDSKPKTQAKPKAKTKGGDTMKNVRQEAEAALIKICKILKLAEPARINAKATSKSGIGALQARNRDGELVATVRDHDVVIYRLQEDLGYGKQGPRGWEYVTVLKHGDLNLEKAFKKGFNIKKDHNQLIDKFRIKRTKKQTQTIESIQAKEARLKAELAELKKARTSIKKTSKASKKGKAVIAKVPAPVMA